jgi:hypothetical protein
LFLPYAFSNLLNSLYQYKLENLFPNICVSLRILLTIPATVASAERSFSKLKLVKNYLHSTMSQDRLVDLARLNIESEIARKINFDNVITRIALIKTRKAPLNAIVKLEAPRSLYSSPGYNNNISQ